MEMLITVGVLAVASGLGIAAWRRLSNSRARRDTPRDDTLRVGSDTAATPEEAAKRAGDRSSWMIPSGF